MAELHNFPMVNQRDGSLNGDFNCVPASIRAGLLYLLGRAPSTDWLKSWAYGASYQGGTAASAYAPFCEQQGVKLYSISGDCVAIAHAELAKGHPVIFTQVDDYSTNPDFTHVCVWYKDGNGGLTAMDPFGGFALTYDDATWRERMRAGDVWIMEKTHMPVPQGWTDTGKEFVAKNGVPVTQGFYQLIKTAPSWDGDNVPQEPEYHADPVQLHAPQFGAGQRQVFRDDVLWWTSAKGVIRESYKGLELHAAYQKIADQAAEIAKLQAAPAPASVPVDVKAIAQKAIDDLQPLVK